MKRIIILICAVAINFASFAAPSKTAPVPTLQDSLYSRAMKVYRHGKIDSARAIWQQISDMFPTDVAHQMRTAALIDMANYAQKKLSNPEDVLRKLVLVSDTSSADVAPLVTGDELTIYFTSNRKHPLGEKMYRKKGVYADNVYRATRSSYENNAWDVHILESPVSSPEHDGTAGLSVDGRSIFIYKGAFDVGYFEMDPIKGAVYMNLNKKYPSLKLGNAHVNSMAVGADEKVVIYSAYELEGGYGKSDLWEIRKDSVSGLYGAPKNLGPVINTTGNEVSVSMTPDGNTIFFASNGHPTIGGYDIYRSSRSDSGTWERPVNLGSPINTVVNDIYYFPVFTNLKHGYYSSENPNKSGVYDIYSVDILKDILSDEDKLLAAKAAADKAEAERLEKERIALESRKQTEAEAKKREEKLKAEAAAREAEAKAREEQLRAEAAAREAEAREREERMKADYAAREDSIKKAAADREAELLSQKGYQDINSLTNIKVGDKVILKNVFFEVGKSAILPMSYPELEKVYNLLVNNPSVRVEISGHTDNTGSRTSNMKLSKARAQSVASYLEAKGIYEGRFSVKGYGPDMPIESNESTIGRALNRRVEFVVIE